MKKILTILYFICLSFSINANEMNEAFNNCFKVTQISPALEGLIMANLKVSTYKPIEMVKLNGVCHVRVGSERGTNLCSVLAVKNINGAYTAVKAPRQISAVCW